MTTTAEITCAIQNDHQSITFRVAAQGEGNATPDLCGMLCQIQTAIIEFQKKPPTKLLSNAEVVVQDVPHPEPAPQSPQANTFSNNKGNGFSQKNAQQQKDNPEKDYPGSITGKQIGKIRYSLKERNIPEKVFCASHDIARIEDLSLNHARALIMNKDF